MGKGRLRNWWSLVAVAAIAVVVAWLLYRLYRSPPARRDDLSTYGAFALAVAVIAVGWLAWAWGKATRRASDAPRADYLDRVADGLASAVHEQWTKAAEDRGLAGTPITVTWSRPSLALAGPVAAAVESPRFGPLPGLPPAGAAELASGRAADLHAVYGGLRSGRLIIAGPPGSGKSGAAVQLVLAALRHRNDVSGRDRPRVPVPVLLTAQDWDPNDQPALKWLAGKLQDAYPVFATAKGAETATALLAAGRITVILDGLDEIAPGLLPVALRALSQQATFRLVLLSRTGELAAAAARQGVLQGAAAVELNPVGPTEAARFLERTQLDPPPLGWQGLTGRIRADPASPLSQALDNPLALTLVRDTYQPGDSIRELLDFCDTLNGTPAAPVDAITGHLLDRVLPAAYTRRPGQKQPPYDLETAHRTLARIAAQMNKDGTRDLNWWHIPQWLPRSAHITRATAVALTVGLGFGLMAGPWAGLWAGLWTGCRAGFGMERSRNRPHVVGDLRLTKVLTPKNVVPGIMFGIMPGAGFAIEFGAVAGIVAGIVAAAGFAVRVWIADARTADPDSVSSLSPITSRHKNRHFELAHGLSFGILGAIGLGFLAGSGSGSGIAVGIAVGIALPIWFGLIDITSYIEWLALVVTALEWRTPVRLMAFLDDAYSRGILRAVGPSYQFRHARLQDRLAARASTSGRAAPPQASQAAGLTGTGEG